MESCENIDICLKGFAKNIQENWKYLQSENDFYDIVFACEGKMSSAHKVLVTWLKILTLKDFVKEVKIFKGAAALSFL